jgi:protein-disulfide isomerase
LSTVRSDSKGEDRSVIGFTCIKHVSNADHGQPMTRQQSRIIPYRLVVFAMLLRACIATVLAQTTVLNYSGRIFVDGQPYSGTGFFEFSIEDTNGSVLWSSGDFPLEGVTNLPPRVLKLTVKEGVYDIQLGNPTLGMPPLDLEALRRAKSPALHIWFNDGISGWHVAGKSAPLAETLTAADQAPISNAQAETILREIHELRALFERSRGTSVAGSAAAPAVAPQTATVSINGCPSLGRADAALVLVEFTDFECPFCKEANETVLPELKKKYIETGKLRLVTRNLALPFHPNAEPAAQAALCAHQQNHFWLMRDKLFATSTALNGTTFLHAAEELKLDVPAFRACLEANTFAERIKKEMQQALAVGISGTPTFVLGKADGDQVTGEVFVGARSFAAFDEDIQKRLSPK